MTTLETFDNKQTKKWYCVKEFEDSEGRMTAKLTEVRQSVFRPIDTIDSVWFDTKEEAEDYVQQLREVLAIIYG